MGWNVSKNSNVENILCRNGKKNRCAGYGNYGTGRLRYGSAVQRQLRDVLVLSIGGVTTQILKNIVTKTIGF